MTALGAPLRDQHCGPVPEEAWAADRIARQRGRVEMLNAVRPGGLDRWTMDVGQYELMRAHILETVDAFADEDGTVSLKLEPICSTGWRSEAPARCRRRHECLTEYPCHST